MYNYAHVNQNGKVYAQGQTETLIVPIPEMDDRLNGTVYNADTGTFIGYRITLTSDKSQIVADGEDTTTITASITTWDDQPATGFEHDIIFEVDGTQIPASVENGQAVFEFVSNETGTYKIKTVNSENTILSNGTIEIEVIESA